MNRVIGWAAGAAMALGVGGALAQDRLVVVELYTSQGCSSCPPADELLGRLAGRTDVLPLALHVDYWDYIGWKDSFAQPGFTARQKAYAHAAGARTIYTPQMVVAGKDHIVGTHAAELDELIEMHSAGAGPVTLDLARAGDRLTVHGTASDATGPMVVQLVRFLPEETVEIRRGENAGRTITYHNIVTGWHEIGRWDGDGPLVIETDAPGDQPVAVIVQQEGPGAILAAATLP